MSHASTLALIAIGANLPGSDGRSAFETCQSAAGCLGRLPGLHLTALSRWYRSAPVPPSGQPDYVNAVAALTVEPWMMKEPRVLLTRLMAIEIRFGRQRSETNAARTLDLDIIGIGGMVITEPDLIVPHPRAHLRAFVLLPLADVAPEWVHPLFGLTARELLTALPPAAMSQHSIEAL